MTIKTAIYLFADGVPVKPVAVYCGGKLTPISRCENCICCLDIMHDAGKTYVSCDCEGL
jgi:hypothetical protein